ncbi:MAG: bifunctional riboflavin kinase/FAD synthetase [Leptospiraceae bacterium]|nr:bifunctional riboflavin kinase/FAD synthetase [Leptospiraceae bacterium]
MDILDFHNLDKEFPEGSIVTLGNFDGVHHGHLGLIEKLLNVQAKKKKPTVLVTYYPNPSIVLGKNKEHKSIYPESKKREILSSFGINYILTIPFTEEFSKISANDFIKDILIRKLNAKHIIIGYNHFFGRGREGDYSYLKKFSSEFGYEVDQIPPVYVNEEKVSSSLIRKLISSGEIIQANKFLSRPFSLHGHVIKGFQRGRQISFPTANIEIPINSICPAIGVYAGISSIRGKNFRSMINIGKKPTFGDETVNIEAYLLDFSWDIYGEFIEHSFLYRIRDEKKFNSIGELTEQLTLDKSTTLKLVTNEQMQQANQ